jgi:heme-degrading monooxygenase HmoA
MNSISRKTLLLCAIATVFSLGVAIGQNKFGQPKSIVHIITVQWTTDSTAAQRQAALDGVKTMASQIPGITNIWLKKIKAQGDKDMAIVMEFKDQAAFDAYAAHPAHKKWEEIYLPIRGQSITFDTTN